MKHKKRYFSIFIVTLFLLCLCQAPKAMAANMCRVIVDANGGLFYFTGAEYGFFDSEFAVEEGSTIASVGNSIAIVGYGGMSFQGWDVYNAGGAQIASGLSTDAVNGYAITEPVNFVAQWSPMNDGNTTEAITYAAWFGDTNTVDYGSKITIIHDGIKYSGYGYVSISMDICSSWTGTVQIIQEFPGHFVNANMRWNPDYFEFELPARSFRKEGDCSFPMSTTGKGKDVPPNSILLSEFYYNVKNHAPDVSFVRSEDENKAPAVTVTPDSPAVPASATVYSDVLISGGTYDSAVAAVSSALGTTKLLVYDITMKDVDGNLVSQFDEPIEVTIAIPEAFSIDADKTVVVYYLSPEGDLEECETTYVVNGDGSRYATFLTDHFSCYVLVECEVIMETEPETTEVVEETAENLDQQDESQTMVQESESQNDETQEEELVTGTDDNEQDGTTAGGTSMVWILMGGMVVLVAVILLVVRKKYR